MTTDIETLVSEAIGLLKSLIAIPSLSREEEQAADFLQNYIEMQGMAQVLPKAGLGWLGVFAVTIIIVAAVELLEHFTNRKK